MSKWLTSTAATSPKTAIWCLKQPRYEEDTRKSYVQRTRCFEQTRFVRFAHTAQRCRRNTADENRVQAFIELKL